MLLALEALGGIDQVGEPLRSCSWSSMTAIRINGTTDSPRIILAVAGSTGSPTIWAGAGTMRASGTGAEPEARQWSRDADLQAPDVAEHSNNGLPTGLRGRLRRLRARLAPKLRHRCVA